MRLISVLFGLGFFMVLSTASPRAAEPCDGTQKACKFPAPPPMFGDPFNLGFGGGQFGSISPGQLGQFGQIGQQIGQFGQFGQQLGQFGQIGQQIGQFGQQLGQFGQIGQFGQQLGQFGGQQVGQVSGQQAGQFGQPLGGAQLAQLAQALQIAQRTGILAVLTSARGASKVAKNEVARPEDRVFTTYDYDYNTNKVCNYHHEVVGLEKTFLDGNASVELRLPFIQVNVDGGFDRSAIGDLSVVAKYALINDRETGNVLSTGLMVTAPTGPTPSLSILNTSGQVEEVHATLLQPFAGYLWNWNSFYVQGFTSVVVPTDSRDTTFLFNDVGVGYWLYQGDGMLTGVVPTVELHVNTPLTHRSDDDPLRSRDRVQMTGGTYFKFGERALLGIGASTPLGPHLFDIEGVVSFNWRF